MGIVEAHDLTRSQAGRVDCVENVEPPKRTGLAYTLDMQISTPWTGAKVAEALVRAFRLMPGRPVLSSGGAFTVDDHVVSAFGWPDRYIADARDRRFLMTWARCLATGESVRELYKQMDWPRSTAERRRRAALAQIAQQLNATKKQATGT